MMSEATWALLKRVFLADYSVLARQVERMTGSADLADDAMQDTFLRLEQGGDIADHVASPRSYLRQMAFNAARQIIRMNRVRSRYFELVELLDTEIPDESPGPEQQVDGRFDLLALRSLLETLPARRRSIFVLAMMDDVPLAEIARRHHIGVRMVQLELKTAREEIITRFRGLNIVDFAKAVPEASRGRDDNERTVP